MTIDKVEKVVTYTSGGAALIFGLTAQEIAAIVAAATCALSFIVGHSMTFYFKQKEFKHKREVDERSLELRRQADEKDLELRRQADEKDLELRRQAIERNTIMTLPSSCYECPLYDKKDN